MFLKCSFIGALAASAVIGSRAESQEALAVGDGSTSYCAYNSSGTLRTLPTNEPESPTRFFQCGEWGY